MPLVTRPCHGQGLLRAAALAAAALVAALLATALLAAPRASAAPTPPSPPPGATTATPPPSCVEPDLTQPFLDWGDARTYVLAPGQADGNFTGDGWTLTGGASIVSTQLDDGSTGQVLDMPSGATAQSPTMCVSAAYPMARTMVRNVTGGEGVGFYVSYANTPSWDKPKNTGSVHGKKNGWTLSDPVNTQPAKNAGWTLARFTFIAKGKQSGFQLYNFYVDPYRH